LKENYYSIVKGLVLPSIDAGPRKDFANLRTPQQHSMCRTKKTVSNFRGGGNLLLPLGYQKKNQGRGGKKLKHEGVSLFSN